MEYTIKMVQQAPTVHDLLPDYQYQFNEIVPNEESGRMYNALVDFICTNEELAISDIIQKDEFAKGFKRAIALTKLWLDSLYIGDMNYDDTNSNTHKVS